jgi:hypothetical protein
MSITPLTFTNGTIITQAAIRTELDRVKNWLNGTVLAADIQSATLSKLHIHRPDTAGFPKENIEGQTQQVTELSNGLNEPTPMPSFDGSFSTVVTADMVTDQYTAFLDAMLPDDRFRMVSKRVALFETSDVEFVCTFFAGTTNDNSAADTANAGHFRLRYQEVSSSTVADVPGSIRKLNPSATINVSGVDTFENGYFEMIGMLEDLAEGVYDFWLEYRRNGAGVALGQVTILLPTLVIETATRS